MNWLDILKILLPIVVDIITHIEKPKASRSTEEIEKYDKMMIQDIASRLRGVASMVEKGEKGEKSKEGG